MTVSKKGLALIKRFEGCRLKAYLCPAGIPTIGYGNTFYANGKKVALGDTITQADAEALLETLADSFAGKVTQLIKRPINQYQFDALVDFAYNTGIGSLEKSTLLKKVNTNPNDSSIKLELLKWTKANGKELPGLVARRQAEVNLYFTV